MYLLFIYFVLQGEPINLQTGHHLNRLKVCGTGLHLMKRFSLEKI